MVDEIYTSGSGCEGTGASKLGCCCTVLASARDYNLCSPETETRARLWYCKQCGYVAFREDPPYICPICKAKKDMFNVITLHSVFHSRTDNS